jgi:hypothetical protein
MTKLLHEAIQLAHAAAAELESLMRADESRLLDPDEQRRLGVALGRIETAECILEDAGEDEARLRAISGEAFALAYAAAHDLARQGSGPRATEALEALLATGAEHARAEEAHARELAFERLGQSE